jgi:hypothetical protein
MTYDLARPTRLGLDEFARLADIHPELLGRFVVLGLVEASSDSKGTLWFRPGQLARIARIRRLRAGLALNYASLGLVLDLLERIAVLEAERRRSAGIGVRTWR